MGNAATALEERLATANFKRLYGERRLSALNGATQRGSELADHYRAQGALTAGGLEWVEEDVPDLEQGLADYVSGEIEITEEPKGENKKSEKGGGRGEGGRLSSGKQGSAKTPERKRETERRLRQTHLPPKAAAKTQEPRPRRLPL